MTSKKFLILVTLSIFMFPQSGASKELKWVGCDISKFAFMEEMAKAYERKSGVKVELLGGGALKGIRSASAGTTDVGGTCRHRLVMMDGSIHEEEKDAELIQVAWDAIVPIANKDNPVDNISLVDLRKIYDGKITSWKELGGNDRTIVFLTHLDKYAGTEYMLRLIVFGDPEYEFRARSLTFKSQRPLLEKLEETPAAFAVTGVSYAIKENLKILSLDGTSPTKEHIASGKYPLFRPLYITFNKNKTNIEVTRFIDFILSPEGQAIISGQGTVNLSEGKALVPLWNEKMTKFGLK
ncbi:MAG: phosphate ABC transporter substrate-binding protein [Nitrospiraceae bacterium]|nr:MAG: phosphate ABC transporter substrate-binding protein [Nitrospiraceae bacterium]